MHWALTQSSAPSVEPVSLADMKTHLRVDLAADNDLITSQIKAARFAVEGFLRRQLITATWKYYLDKFPGTILLPRPPLQSISSITYTDSAGDTQTLSSSVYDVDTDSIVGRVVEAYGQAWPTTREDINVVCVTFVAGYGDAATDVPDNIISGVKLLVTDLYEHRGAQAERRLEENKTLWHLLWPYRVLLFEQGE